jgi:hypothetical protein
VNRVRAGFYNNHLVAGLFEQAAASFELLIARVRRMG